MPQGREPWIEPDCVGSHRRAGSLPRQAQQQPSSESSRPRSRASSAPAPITPLRWLVSVGGIGSAPVLAHPHTHIGMPPHTHTHAYPGGKHR